jgi:hypothetical protein
MGVQKPDPPEPQLIRDQGAGEQLADAPLLDGTADNGKRAYRVVQKEPGQRRARRHEQVKGAAVGNGPGGKLHLIQ